MVNFSLRDYQREVVDRSLEAINGDGNGRFMVQLPTGMGKTVIFSHIIGETKLRTLVIAHRGELLQQARSKISEIAEIAESDIDIVQQSTPRSDAKIWVASIQTLCRGGRANKISPELIIIDEAHHSIAASYQKVLSNYSCPVLGFTATPTRNSRRERNALVDAWDRMIYNEYTIKKAIIDNYLAMIYYYRVQTDISLDDVKTSAGDFQSDDLARAVNVNPRNDAIVEKYISLGCGKAIVFCANVEHTKTLARTFVDYGISSFYVTGKTDSDSRDEAIRMFKDANISENLVLTNCMVLTEGFDCPDVRQVILARPTKSPTVYLQQIGRGTRTHPDKDGVFVVDVVDNCRSKKLCNCLKTVFGLHHEVEIEGDVIEKIRKPKKDKVVDDFTGLSVVKDDGYEDVNIVLSKILFDMPIVLERSKLNWFSTEEDEYVVNVANNCSFIINEDVLSSCVYKKDGEDICYLGKHKVLEDAVEFVEKTIQEEYGDQEYIWNKRVVKKWKGGATEKQIKTLEKLYKDKKIKLESLTKQEASRLISAKISNNNKKPASDKQKRYLRALGYSGPLEELTSRDAGRLIGEYRK